MTLDDFVDNADSMSARFFWLYVYHVLHKLSLDETILLIRATSDDNVNITCCETDLGTMYTIKNGAARAELYHSHLLTLAETTYSSAVDELLGRNKRL